MTHNPATGDCSSLFTTIPFPNPDHLTTPFSLEDIKKATFQLGGDKAPRPDGFNMTFFQKFREVVKDDLLNISADMFQCNLHSGPMDYSYICLIPKKEEATTASDFRPISLISSVQKIISMVLANRLAGVMKDIISLSQSAFIKGRFILDSLIATANEITSWCSKTGVESVGVKADFEKAYDRVRWNFLKKILTWLGANRKWCYWIEQCISNAKVAVLVNGSPTK